MAELKTVWFSKAKADTTRLDNPREEVQEDNEADIMDLSQSGPVSRVILILLRPTDQTVGANTQIVIE